MVQITAKNMLVARISGVGVFRNREDKKESGSGKEQLFLGLEAHNAAIRR